MIKLILDPHLIALLQEKVPAFRNVPTQNNRPVVHIWNNKIQVSHVDMSVDAICDWGQIPMQVSIYQRALTEAELVLGSSSTQTLRSRLAAFEVVLNTYQPPQGTLVTPFDNKPSIGIGMDVEDMVEELGDILDEREKESIRNAFGRNSQSDENRKKGELVLALISNKIDHQSVESMEAYFNSKMINPAKAENAVFVYLKDWYETAIQLMVIDTLPRLLDAVLQALKREQENRDNGLKLDQLKDQVDGFSAQLHAAKVETAVAMIRAMGLTIGEKREDTVRVMFPDIAKEVLSMLMPTEA